MINSIRDLELKTLVAIVYESGARINEILNLRLQDVLFDDIGPY